MGLIFWCCAIALAHTYVGYPFLLVLIDAVRRPRKDLRRLAGRRGGSASKTARELPMVSLVVAAWNEAEVIGRKLENSLALDYPPERFEVIIGSDGSDDGTDEIVAACPDPRVRLSLGETRTGKASVLNRTIARALGEVIVLSDANTELQPDALRKLVRHFDDRKVGCVCGNLRLYNPSKAGYEESAYWLYESFLKFHEGKHGVVMGANGGLYAIRRRAFRALPASTVVDDFVIAQRCLQQGLRVVYEPEAIAYEETTEDYEKERTRRVRIAAGNFQSLSLVGGLLHPRHGLAAFAFFSHKLLRWVAPALLVALFVSNLALLRSTFFQLTLALQVAFYWLALVGYVAKLEGPLGKLASAARYFVEMNVGIAQGFVRYVRGTQKVTWDRTERSLEAKV